MLRLLGRLSSANVQKVAWLLTEMGVAFEREDYGGKFGGNRSADYLRLNPNGVVPLLIDGETTVWESNTILRYVANRFGPMPFYPVEPGARADCERWMDWQLGTLNLAMTPLYIALIRTPAHERDMDALRRYEARARELFRIMDDTLAERSYLAGEGLTLADFTIAMFAYRWHELDVDRGLPTPHLERWYARICERPAFIENVMIGLS